jgi:uncharacterized protein YkwD
MPGRTGALLVCALLTALMLPARAEQPESLAALRAAALAAVNRDRSGHGLPPLRASERLDRAAQMHADDMLRRSYFSHISPEGGTVGDRFQALGGSVWQLVEENIAACNGCATPPISRRVSIFEHGLMQSREHRENILRPGIIEFGYGIAGAGDRVYAVQTFAGAGAPRGSDAESAQALSPAAQLELALRQFNAARRSANLPPLQPSRDLTEVARKVVSNDPDDSIDAAKLTYFDALSDEDGAWAEVRLRSWRCGGCGMRPTAADVRYFAQAFLLPTGADAKPLAREIDAAGFAMTADGKGMKSAVLLLGRRRR